MWKLDSNLILSMHYISCSSILNCITTLTLLAPNHLILIRIWPLVPSFRLHIPIRSSKLVISSLNSGDYPQRSDHLHMGQPQASTKTKLKTMTIIDSTSHYPPRLRSAPRNGPMPPKLASKYRSVYSSF